MKNEILDKLFEVREYFLTQQPKEGDREREMLDLLDMIIDEVEE